MLERMEELWSIFVFVLMHAVPVEVPSTTPDNQFFKGTACIKHWSTASSHTLLASCAPGVCMCTHVLVNKLLC